MKGFLLFVVGMVIGALLLAAAQVFLIPAPALSQAGTGSPDLVILFRNGFLTRELQRQAAGIQSAVPLKGLVVRGQPDQNLVILGDVSATNTSLTVPARIILHPTVARNRVSVQVIKMDVGTLTIPGQYLHGIEGPINNALNRWMATSPYTITGVSTTNEGLVVDVVVKGQ